MLTHCDMCGTEIKDGKCSCGIWQSEEEMKDCPFRKSLEKFHELKRFTLTADSPHLGCAVVYFRGDYNDCKKVETFIKYIKNRAFYE